MRYTNVEGTLNAENIRDHFGQMEFGTAEAFGQAVKQGALDSFGLGTAIQYLSTPTGTTKLSRDDYGNSPYYREEIPWDEGMTEERAAVLADWYDNRQVRQRLLDQTDTFGVQTVGSIVGQAFDPVNYIPVAGPAARAIGVARASGIGGRALFQSLDAAGNTALAGTLTSGLRDSFGQDTSFETTMTEIVAAAFIGGVFGAGTGALLHARSKRAATAVKNHQTASATLNDAITSFVEDGEIRVSETVAQRLDDIALRNNPALYGDLLAQSDRPGLRPATALGNILDARPPEVGEFETFLREQAAGDDPALKNARGKVEAAAKKINDIDTLVRKAAVDANAAAANESALVRIGEIDSELAKLRGRTDRRAQKRFAGRIEALETERAELLSRADLQDMFAENARIARTERSSLNRADRDRMRAKAAQELEAAQRELAEVEANLDAAAQRHLAQTRALYRPKTDLTRGRTQPPPERLEVARVKAGKPVADMRELADEFGLDESGNFAEMDDIKAMEADGRMTAAEKLRLEKATEIAQRSDAYADALQRAALCEVA